MKRSAAAHPTRIVSLRQEPAKQKAPRLRGLVAGLFLRPLLRGPAAADGGAGKGQAAEDQAVGGGFGDGALHRDDQLRAVQTERAPVSEGDHATWRKSALLVVSAHMIGE